MEASWWQNRCEKSARAGTQTVNTVAVDKEPTAIYLPDNVWRIGGRGRGTGGRTANTASGKTILCSVPIC